MTKAEPVFLTFMLIVLLSEEMISATLLSELVQVTGDMLLLVLKLTVKVSPTFFWYSFACSEIFVFFVIFKLLVGSF